jgi:ferredoxin
MHRENIHVRKSPVMGWCRSNSLGLIGERSEVVNPATKGRGRFSPEVEDQQMPWTITRLCRDCLDTGCVSVCPVDCIYEYTGDDREKFPNQLYIHPDECIDCGACEPECPWQAIFEEPAVPEIFKDDIPLNHATVEMHDQFKVALFQKKEHPTPEQIAANKVKWGMDPNA